MDNSSRITCESCKQTVKTPDEHTADKRCTIEYQLVDNCMKEFRGSIRECAHEWGAFRKCRDSTQSVQRESV